MLALAVLLAASPTQLPLPAPAPVIMDYLAADGDRVWVPAGNTGKVFVLKEGKFAVIDGFPTKEGRGGRLMGPSSVTVGEGFAYVGNRGDSKICAIDSRSLEKKGCAETPGMPDGTFYVATTKEVWVTTPREKSLQILDVKDPAAPKLVAKIELEGEPEGYAVDAGGGLVYNNLEDKDRTLVIDARTRKPTAKFEPGCGEKGPRGLAVDAGRGLLLVACTDGVVSLDAKTGARKGRLDTGAGVDNIDYVGKRVYVSAGQAEKLTVADVGDDGSFKPVASAKVGKGCRVVVATKDGTAYAADSAGGQLWMFKP
jgi:DNA-binding beta-propeller fold protein YncE